MGVGETADGDADDLRRLLQRTSGELELVTKKG